ncbi:unnamed protein product [Chrysoparadoxa australica]
MGSSTCRSPGCPVSANYNLPGLPPQYCASHKAEGMVHKTKQLPFPKTRVIRRASSRDSTKPAKVPSPCSPAAKPESAVRRKTVTKRYCDVEGCSSRPHCGYVDQPGKTHCSTHMLEGMVFKTKSNKAICDYSNCKKVPCCGFPGTKPSRCGLHQLEGMFNWTSKCASKGCTRTRRFGRVSDPKPSVCLGHRSALTPHDFRKGPQPQLSGLQGGQEVVMAEWDEDATDTEGEEEKKAATVRKRRSSTPAAERGRGVVIDGSSPRELREAGDGDGVSGKGSAAGGGGEPCDEWRMEVEGEAAAVLSKAASGASSDEWVGDEEEAEDSDVPEKEWNCRAKRKRKRAVAAAVVPNRVSPEKEKLKGGAPTPVPVPSVASVPEETGKEDMAAVVSPPASAKGSGRGGRWTRERVVTRGKNRKPKYGWDGWDDDEDDGAVVEAEVEAPVAVRWQPQPQECDWLPAVVREVRLAGGDANGWLLELVELTTGKKDGGVKGEAGGGKQGVPVPVQESGQVRRVVQQVLNDLVEAVKVKGQG